MLEAISQAVVLEGVRVRALRGRDQPVGGIVRVGVYATAEQVADDGVDKVLPLSELRVFSGSVIHTPMEGETGWFFSQRVSFFTIAYVSNVY